MDDIKKGKILQTEGYNIQDELETSIQNLLLTLDKGIQTGFLNKDEIKDCYNRVVRAKKAEAEFMKCFYSCRKDITDAENHICNLKQKTEQLCNSKSCNNCAHIKVCIFNHDNAPCIHFLHKNFVQRND